MERRSGLAWVAVMAVVGCSGAPASDASSAVPEGGMADRTAPSASAPAPGPTSAATAAPSAAAGEEPATDATPVPSPTAGPAAGPAPRTGLPSDPTIPDGPMPLHERRRAAQRAHIVQMTSVQKDAQGVRVTEVWTYNAAGDPLTHRATIRRGGVMSESWVYAGPQQPRQHRYRDAQQAWTATFRYRFDAEGRLAEKTREVSTGESYRWTTFYERDGGYTIRGESSADAYDPAGLLLQDCGPSSCTLSSYDENGHLRSRRFQSGPDHHVMHIESKADEAGRLVEQRDGGMVRLYRRNGRGDVVERVDRLAGEVEHTTTYRYVYR